MAEMNNKKKDLNVPPLRFPEFKGEWDDVQLGNLLTFKNGLNCDAEKYGKGIKNISVSDVLQFSPITYSSVRGSVDATEQQKEEFKVSFGDVLFQRSSETPEDIGRSNVYLDQQPCVFGGFVIRGKPIKGFNPLFFKYLMATKSARHEVIKRGAGAQHYNIGQEQLALVKVRMPEDEEQCKISSFLNVIDRRIDVQRKTIEDWKNIKSHIVNSEFSACTEPLASSIEEVSERYKSCDENYEVFSVSNIKGFTRQAEQFEGKAIAGENKSNYKIVRSGVFAYNPARINVGSIARYSGVRPVIVSPMYICFQAKKNYRPEYLAYFFISNSFTKQMNSLLEGSVRQCLLFDSLRQIKLPQRDASKQKDFVEKVKMIDALICCETYFFEKLKTMKEYLLRDLFT